MMIANGAETNPWPLDPTACEIGQDAQVLDKGTGLSCSDHQAR
jgi:hypothetical protein